MDIASRDAIVQVLIKHIRESQSSWGYAPGPTKEMLASLVVARAVCAAWQEEVSGLSPL
jgi:hypothetical protein